MHTRLSFETAHVFEGTHSALGVACREVQHSPLSQTKSLTESETLPQLRYEADVTTTHTTTYR